MEQVVLAMLSLLRTTRERPQMVLYTLTQPQEAPPDSELLGTAPWAKGDVVLEIFVKGPTKAKRLFVGHWTRV